MESIRPDSAAPVETLPQAHILLVATDFDGSITPIVSRPSCAEANREAVVALKQLAATPQTYVAIVSGRALYDPSTRTRELPDVHLVGSRGSEFESGVSTALATDEAPLLGRLSQFLGELVTEHPRLGLKKKPAALALHYRGAPPDIARRAIDAIQSGLATWPGVHARHGECVMDLSVIATNEGFALHRLR